MYFFFADDSTQKGIRKGMQQIVSFGGVFLSHENLLPFRKEFEKVLIDSEVPLSEEIKWSPRRDSWIYTNLKGEKREKCYSAILVAAQKFGAKVVVTAIDGARANLKPEWAEDRCVLYTLERVSLFLDDQKTEGVIICDRPGGGQQQDQEFLTATLQTLEDETNYILPANIVLPVLTAPSNLNRHLQLADLIVGVTTAMVAGQYKYAQPLFEFVRPLMIENALGYRGGTGLKLYPNDLINLYHWVLGETTFAKASRMAGFTLPTKKADYFDDGGI